MVVEVCAAGRRSVAMAAEAIVDEPAIAVAERGGNARRKDGENLPCNSRAALGPRVVRVFAIEGCWRGSRVFAARDSFRWRSAFFGLA